MEKEETPVFAQSSFDLSRFKVVKGNRGSARGDILDRFLDRLNPTRVSLGYKKLNHARLSMMLQHIKGVDELNAFYSQCEKSNIPFGAFFHWALKPNKKNRSDHLTK